MKLSGLFSVERVSALFTWLVVSVSAVYLAWAAYGAAHWRLWLTILLCLLVLLAFVQVSDESNIQRRRQRALWGFYLVAVSLYWVLPYNHLAIFVVIWSALIPYYFSWRTCLRIGLLAGIPQALAYEYYWQQSGGWLSALLFMTFNLFAMVMSRAIIREASARATSEELNRELQSTQQLLAQAASEQERLRIAREIHDLLGHHLTALTINLQVASRISSGEAKQHIDQCHGLARLLLADVRETVSEMREQPGLNWQRAVEVMFEQLPGIELQMQVDAGAELTHLQQASVLLRCVQESLTNMLRHSQSKRMQIRLSRSGDTRRLWIADSGGAAGSWQEGNGLQGMRERLSEIGASVQFSRSASGFETEIQWQEPVV